MSRSHIFLLLLAVTYISAHEESRFHQLRPLLEFNRNVLTDSSIVLDASVQKTAEGGEEIKFNLEGVKEANEKDLVLLFSPSDVDPAQSSPVAILSGEDMGEGYLKEGRMSSAFGLFPLTSPDYIIHFYKHKEDKLHRSASSSPLRASASQKPSGVHISVTERGQISVQWGTPSNTQQYLKYRQSSATDYKMIKADRDTYAKSDMCGEPASSYGWMDPGFLWNTTVPVSYNKKYFYSVGSDSTGWSTETTFSSPPSPNRGSQVRFLAMGDLGTNDNRGCGCTSGPARTVFNMLNDRSDFVIHIGDISYARGIASEWPNFLSKIEPIASQKPWMTLPGNHERDWTGTGTINGTDSGGECGIPFEKRFKMPQTSHSKPWYTFNYGPVHFSFISTELPFTVGSPQYQWLDADLKSVNRSLTPWVVVAGHRPMYISSTNFNKGNGDQTIAIQLRKEIESLLFKYKVDVAFWGHHHSYQRTCPVYQEKCTQGATTHVVAGNAGAGLSTNLQKPQPAFFKYIDDKRWGHTRITVDRKSFKLEYVANDSNGKVADSFTLTKK